MKHVKVLGERDAIRMVNSVRELNKRKIGKHRRGTVELAHVKADPISETLWQVTIWLRAAPKFLKIKVPGGQLKFALRKIGDWQDLLRK